MSPTSEGCTRGQASRDDVDILVSAANDLLVEPRGDRWCHLSLCLIDAVFSIGAHYTSTKAAARQYATAAGLTPVTAPAGEVAAGRHQDTEESLGSFVEFAGRMDPIDFADLLGNHQWTSTRGSAILKADAVLRFARILTGHLAYLSDVAGLVADPGRLDEVEAALAAVPGHGAGIRTSYLWMLTGDDQRIKADRMVTRWVARAVGRPVDVPTATALVTAAADRLNVTPWMLDHAIWRSASGRTSPG